MIVSTFCEIVCKINDQFVFCIITAGFTWAKGVSLFVH